MNWNETEQIEERGPAKLIHKLPMKKMVIDEEHSCWIYEIDNGKVVYKLHSHLYPEA